MKASPLIRALGCVSVGLLLSLGALHPLEGQVPDPANANLDSLRTELERVTRELSSQIQYVIEQNLRQGTGSTDFVRSEIVRTVDVRRATIETLRTQISQAESARAGQVTGIVTSAETGEGISAVSLIIERTTASVGMLSDASGRFTFRGLPPGTHALTARRPGFEDLRQTVVITRGATTNLELTMTAQAVRLPIQLRDAGIPPGTQISFIDQDGNLRTLSEFALPPTTNRSVPDGGLPLVVVDGVPMEPSSPVVLGRRFVAGVELAPLNPTLARYFDVESGVLVLEVTDPSPGADAGLQPGDVLVSVRERPVHTVEDVRQAFGGIFATRAATDGIPLRVIRDGTAMELRIPPS